MARFTGAEGDDGPRDGTLRVPVEVEPAEPGPPGGRTVLPVGRLARDLCAEVEGEVRFDAGSRALYAHDASNFRQVPVGVVVPRTAEDVVAVHRLCHRYGAPVLDRGGGTSLSGETVNHAVVVDHSKYLTRIGRLDTRARRVTCQPGVINEELNRHTGPHGLVFGPDPSTHSRCAIGGNIGNNSCGIHSVQSQLYGPGPRTSDNLHALEVVTYGGDRFRVGVDEERDLDAIIAAGGRKGEIYARLRALRDRYADAIRAGFPSVRTMPRRVSGYNLDELLPENGFNVARALAGTEGTCATVLEAELLLTPALLCRRLVAVEYGSIAEAADHVPRLMEHFAPVGLEALDKELITDQQRQNMNPRSLRELPEPGGGAWLLVQFGADTDDEATEQARGFAAWLRRTEGFAGDRITVADEDPAGAVPAQDLWAVREAGLGSTAFPPSGEQWPGWEDSAVPPERLGSYVRELTGLMERYGLRGAMYGHFAQGCIHSRIGFDLRDAEGVARYRSFLEEAAALVGSYGGSLSGEHGDGQQRGELLNRQYSGELLDAMREFKLIWDPQARMNPGKVVDPYPLDADLRLGPDTHHAHPRTTLHLTADDDDFAHATQRCVGVGACRNPRAADQQTMCPSYQVTREEKHSTRGRARLLYEMLRGEVITDGWQSTEVADALDLCLACKGCTSDCPVDVDIPSYKAEFLHHHYRSLRRWRPRYAYAFGFIDQAARAASWLPELADAATHAPGAARLARAVAGIDRRRPLPGFAPTTLRSWYRRRGTANPDGRPVVLFPDTFTNHFHTGVGVAAVEAIEAAGGRVLMPDRHLCCGRPLYDYGFLDAAERYLRRVVDVLRPHLRAGTPVVGMEPSCLAVFKDELSSVLPHDDDARRLRAGARHFAQFFRDFGIEPPRMAQGGTALLWGHCHERATGGVAAERELLEGMGLRTRDLAGGCCGLAGSWGFEDGKYGISLECGEQALLPAVREADTGTAVVANGFSCRTQLDHAGTGRAALHLAELMRAAHRGEERPADTPPEEVFASPAPRPGAGRRAARAATAAAVCAVPAVAARAAGRRGGS